MTHRFLKLDAVCLPAFLYDKVKIKDEESFNSIKAQLFLMEAYDIEYGLYNHDDPKLEHPLQTHIMTEKKMILKHGLYKEYMERYNRHQILKYFGISFIEFLDLPIVRAEQLLEQTTEWLNLETKQLEKLKRDIDNTSDTNEKQMMRY